MCQKKFENMQHIFQKNTANFFFNFFMNKKKNKNKNNTYRICDCGSHFPLILRPVTA